MSMLHATASWSHTDVLPSPCYGIADNSGARVRELSAPLAAAGISIFYQSSYMSDFIFVKTSRLSEVMALFATAGFDLYSSDPLNLTSQMSPLLSPTASDDGSNVFDPSLSDDPYGQAPYANGAVLSRTRSPSLTSIASASIALSLQNGVHAWNSEMSHHLDVTQDPHISTSISPNSDSTIASGLTLDAMASSNPSIIQVAQPTPKVRVKKSLSPTSAPVDMLPTDLACVGLNDNLIDSWSLKIIKLVSFPELIPDSSKSVDNAEHSPRESAYMRSPLTSDVLKQAQAHPPFSGSDESGDELHPLSPTDSLYSSESEEEYFSSSPPYRRGRDSPATPSLVSGWSSSSRSLPDLLSTNTQTRLRSGSGSLKDRKINGGDSADERDYLNVVEEEEGSKELFDRNLGASTATVQRHWNSQSPRFTRTTPPTNVPFFSFTRTSEGSSLTTDVRVLAHLFKPHERHMVICREDLLENADRMQDLQTARAHLAGRDGGMFDMDMETDEEDGMGDEGTMRCLQIDLRKFGLGMSLITTSMTSSH